MLIPLVATLTGCGSTLSGDENIWKNNEQFEASYPEPIRPRANSNGSLFQDGHEMTLYQNRVAGRVGDLITIKLQEQVSGKKSANTATGKASGFDAAIPIVGTKSIAEAKMGLDSSSTFKGTGSSDQSSTLSGTITGTVAKVYGNGNMLIRGQTLIKLNRGSEHVRISGIIRRDDIDDDNTVSSQRVSHARIEYGNKGQLSDANRPGVISRFLGRFFPF
jgi:flagellar L-ring protein precursor FlgH